jgi:SAM-dependent methyltransferase
MFGDFVMGETDIIEGCGPVDILLAKWRYKVAVRQIGHAGKKGRILDIGCGAYPLFLASVDFAEKYGLDSNITDGAVENAKKDGIALINHNIDADSGKFPFEDDYFDVVTMLAVFEHLEPNRLVDIHRDVYRILKPDGLCVLTTPAFWTDGLLRLLARLHVISGAPIRQHKGSYDYSAVSSVLCRAGFEKNKLRFGYFELFMNMWVTATK